jgi:hypothetical protein
MSNSKIINPMKTKVNIFRRLAVTAMAVLFFSAAVFAAGAGEVYLNGSSNSSAGDYVITSTDEVYHYQGEVYEVYNVYYDNPERNMKIAVLEKDGCRSYIAFTKDFWFQYNCTRDGFGIRKAMFNSEDIRDSFDHREYHNQSVLLDTRKIGKDEAVGLIAAYMPKLQG